MSKDIRLETMPFEYDGKTYVLRCNMNVLADVQDENDGNIAAALDERHPVKSVLSFLAAMMNDYADEMHWPERFTARQLGRNLRQKDVPGEAIMRLVISAIIPDTKPEETENTDEKN